MLELYHTRHRKGCSHALMSSTARRRRVVRSQLTVASFMTPPPSWMKEGERVKCVAHNDIEFTIFSGKGNRSIKTCGVHFDPCKLVELGSVYKSSVGNDVHICSTTQCHVLQSDGLTTICSVTGLIVPIDTLIHHVEYDEHSRPTNVNHTKTVSDQTTLKLSRAMRTYISLIRIWTRLKTRNTRSIKSIEWFEKSRFLSRLIYQAAELYRGMNLQRRKNHTKASHLGRPYSTSIRFRLFSAAYLILYLQSLGRRMIYPEMELYSEEVLHFITRFILKSRIDTAKFNNIYRPELSDASVSQLTSFSQGSRYFNSLRTNSIFKTQKEILTYSDLHGWSRNLQPVLL